MSSMAKPADAVTSEKTAASVTVKKTPLGKKLFRARYLYLMLLPVVIYYVMFRYIPLLNNVIAFKDYNPWLGVWGSEWNNFEHFKKFLSSAVFPTVLRNTVVISLFDIAFTFTSSIVFALLLNELKNQAVKSTTQILSYLPHFISLVVIAGMFLDFFSVNNGFISKIVYWFTGESKNLLYEAKNFWWIYTLICVWKGMGWGSIIYVAAMSRISPALYEAAGIDGANSWNKIWHVTLPGIAVTIITMLIVKIGQMLNVGYELIILINNSQNWATSDVISVYVYRLSLGYEGIFTPDFGYASAIGLFQSVFGFILVIFSNKISNKLAGTGLW